MPADSNFAQLIVDPIVQVGSLTLVGAIITRIVLYKRPKLRLVGHLALFAGLTILLLYHGIVPYEPAPVGAPVLEVVFTGLAKIIWWISAAWALIGFVRVFLNFERRPREGRLIQDLTVGIIYLGASLSVIANVFSAPIGTLIATSGVLAIILGLAMQSTLSDASRVSLSIWAGRTPSAIGLC